MRMPSVLRVLFVAAAMAWPFQGCRVGYHGHMSPDATPDAAAPSDATVSPDAARDAAQPPDAAPPDAAIQDAAPPDAAIQDAAPPDAAPPDASIHVCPPTGTQDCSPGPGTGEGDQCFDAPSCFLANVQSAVNATLAGNPSWFDYTVDPSGCPYILEVDLFLDAVVAHLVNQSNRCAIRDPNAPYEEITVKHNNDFSENFDIVASTGCARYGAGIYTGYCTPAWW